MIPEVSIIIPVRNGSNYLQDALDHIRRQNVSVEIIVIDDASTDNTANIAKENGCIVISNETCQGQVVGKNKGIHIAKGEYIMFHDHDDMMTDGALANLISAMDNDTTAVMAKVEDFYSPEMTEQQRKESQIKSEPYYGLFTGAIITHRSAFDTIGDFSENISAGEIMEWEQRMNQHGLKIKKIDIVACKRRIHTSNFGKTNKQKEFKDYAAILRARILASKTAKN